MALPILGYWDIRGNTEPIRMVLHYSNTPFQDKRYNYGPTAETLRSEWLADKPNLGLDFPNLPYFIDGDLKLTQSTAILRHVARKHNLVGESEEQQARLEMFEQQAIDLRVALTSLCYNVDKFDELKPEFVRSIADRLKPWSAVLGENKYLAGDRLTYVDFLLFDVLDIYRIFEASALTAFPNLVQYVERIEKLPTIAAYFSSGKYHKLPYNGLVAKWGNRRE